jgi:glucose/arabinose dehydrogenase
MAPFRAAVLVLALAACSRDPAPAASATAAASTGAATTAAASTGAATAAATSTAAIDREPDAVPAAIVHDVALREIAHGLARPVGLVVAPGDPRRRLFVVEQRGAIRVIEDGRVQPRPFFTITGLSNGNEEGLLGLAFAPDFATSGRLFVDYTSADRATHIVEYRVSRSDPDAVDPSSARELVRIAHPFSNHNGGELEIGPDGALYAGMGDGGSEDDPLRNGQNPDTLLSKLLRFDLAAARPSPEIVHTGLRNPWRFTFDAKTGDLYIADVGQNLWEEVDVVPASSPGRSNFGWSVMEGAHCFDRATGMTQPTCDQTGLTLPVEEYSHQHGCSITGGLVYRGKALPALDGVYFYADYCTGMLRSFRWQGGAVRDGWDWTDALDTKAKLAQISTFGTDAGGELYLVMLTGTIDELVPAGAR